MTTNNGRRPEIDAWLVRPTVDLINRSVCSEHTAQPRVDVFMTGLELTGSTRCACRIISWLKPNKQVHYLCDQFMWPFLLFQGCVHPLGSLNWLLTVWLLKLSLLYEINARTTKSLKFTWLPLCCTVMYFLHVRYVDLVILTFDLLTVQVLATLCLVDTALSLSPWSVIGHLVMASGINIYSFFFRYPKKLL